MREKVETTWQQRTESGGEVKRAQGGMSMEEVEDRVVLGIGATHDRGESMIMEGDRKGNGKTIAWQYTIEGRIEGRRGSHVCDWDKKPRR